MKHFFYNWHFMRYAQLAFGLLSIAQAIDTKQWYFLLFALFFLYKALFNVGCNENGCSINNKRK